LIAEMPAKCGVFRSLEILRMANSATLRADPAQSLHAFVEEFPIFGVSRWRQKNKFLRAGLGSAFDQLNSAPNFGRTRAETGSFPTECAVCQWKPCGQFESHSLRQLH
jgi:hypothetical protein